MTASSVEPIKLLSLKDVCDMTGLSYTLIQRVVSHGLFPYARCTRHGSRYLLADDTETIGVLRRAAEMTANHRIPFEQAIRLIQDGTIPLTEDIHETGQISNA